MVLPVNVRLGLALPLGLALREKPWPLMHPITAPVMLTVAAPFSRTAGPLEYLLSTLAVHFRNPVAEGGMPNCGAEFNVMLAKSSASISWKYIPPMIRLFVPAGSVASSMVHPSEEPSVSQAIPSQPWYLVWFEVCVPISTVP